MPDRVIISDASTIIGLLNIGSLDILQELYTRIEVTSIVRREVGMPLPDWIVTNDDYNKDTYQSMIPMLDQGEASAIALALMQSNCLLIIDERKGRQHAMKLSLQITGLTGVIIRAKREGHLSSGKDKLDELLASGFRLSSKIYRLALREMNEEEET
jgi:predicted nucleic acid-binding protein